MRAACFVRTAVCLLTGCSPLLCLEDFANYRGFELGSSIVAATRQAGRSPSDLRRIQTRPALLQELNWRPTQDPVEEGLLRFYNGRLFQIIVVYDRQKLEGMTQADIVEGISKVYGTAITKFAPADAEIHYHSNYAELTPVVARWTAPRFTCTLIETGNRDSYALLLTHVELDRQARAAIIEASRLDAVDAPRRAAELLSQQERDNEALRMKARARNALAFRP